MLKTLVFIGHVYFQGVPVPDNDVYLFNYENPQDITYAETDSLGAFKAVIEYDSLSRFSMGIDVYTQYIDTSTYCYEKRHIDYSSLKDTMYIDFNMSKQDLVEFTFRIVHPTRHRHFSPRFIDVGMAPMFSFNHESKKRGYRFNGLFVDKPKRQYSVWVTKGEYMIYRLMECGYYYKERPMLFKGNQIVAYRLNNSPKIKRCIEDEKAPCGCENDFNVVIDKKSIIRCYPSKICYRYKLMILDPN